MILHRVHLVQRDVAIPDVSLVHVLVHMKEGPEALGRQVLLQDVIDVCIERVDVYWGIHIHIVFAAGGCLGIPESDCQSLSLDSFYKGQ